MKKVAFHNLGCKVNSYEMELMQQNFTDSGYEIVSFSEKADIYIINTCTVTNIADRKSRQMLHKAKQLNPQGIVVAVGCYVETDIEGVRNDESIDFAVGNKDKSDIVRRIEEYIRDNSQGNCTCNGVNSHILSTLHEHTRAYIKIQDGCNQFCSYCIIPYSRGRISTRNEEETLQEIEGLAAKGCKEFVLTGIHLSSYGLDCNSRKVTVGENRIEYKGQSYNEAAGEGEFTNYRLIEIIERVASIKGVERLRLGSLEPRIITDTFLARMAAIKEFCPHFHLSLQSGSNEVLKRMNRHYTAEEFCEKAVLIRKYFEHPALTTDVIVGFPGETDEEFVETREFLNKVDFYQVHVFKYSRRRGTVADKMPGQLTDKVKNERSKLLISDSAIREERFKDYYEGREETILIEECVNKPEGDELKVEEYKGDSSDSMYVGFNREYVKYFVKSNAIIENEMITGRVNRCK